MRVCVRDVYVCVRAMCVCLCARVYVCVLACVCDVCVCVSCVCVGVCVSVGGCVGDFQRMCMRLCVCVCMRPCVCLCVFSLGLYFSLESLYSVHNGLHS